MKINIHAGHCPDGGTGSGAVGHVKYKDKNGDIVGTTFKESTQARKVVKYAITYLEYCGVKVYDCTCDSNCSQNTCLSRIVSKCNDNAVDFDISVHFNSGANERENGETTGVEAWVSSLSGSKEKLAIAERFRKRLKGYGFKDRGTKVNPNLYVLKHTDSPAILLEVCFTDDPDDAKLYYEVGAKAVGRAIAEAILDRTIDLNPIIKTTARLNMRQKASIKSGILQTVPKGSTVTFLAEKEKDGNIYWHKCRYNGTTGWMSGNYLEVPK